LVTYSKPLGAGAETKLMVPTLRHTLTMVTSLAISRPNLSFVRLHSVFEARCQ
jgi:hypothetical protein